MIFAHMIQHCRSRKSKGLIRFKDSVNDASEDSNSSRIFPTLMVVSDLKVNMDKYNTTMIILYRVFYENLTYLCGGSDLCGAKTPLITYGKLIRSNKHL
jgi:hypothetical protein